jgi:hypothetical protein
MISIVLLFKQIWFSSSRRKKIISFINDTFYKSNSDVKPKIIFQIVLTLS